MKTIEFGGNSHPNVKRKVFTGDQFVEGVLTVTEKELQLILTLRRRGVTQDEFEFFDQALDDPAAIDAVIDLLAARLGVPGFGKKPAKNIQLAEE